MGGDKWAAGEVRPRPPLFSHSLLTPHHHHHQHHHHDDDEGNDEQGGEYNDG